MKVAFISYEYPPDTAYGGIATYVYQAARMLHERGHHVEVFTSSPYRSGTSVEDHLLIHRVKEAAQENFSEPIGRAFAERHAALSFDVLEGPEFCADARGAVRLVPDIPLVLKLHTPSILLLKLNYCEPSFLRKISFCGRALLKGSRPSWTHVPEYAAARLHSLQVDDVERLHALDADELATPSRSLGAILGQEWGLDAAMINHVPYPYIPSEKLLKIPPETYTNVVTFVGRLEIRKGVLDLAHAIPLILQRLPKTIFRFVGPSEASPRPHVDMQQYLRHILRKHRRSVEFTGPVALDSIADILARTDICVFPSLWENFPCVCLEAMAAARGIIGSNAGGMAEMLDFGGAGQVIPPRSPERIAHAVIELLEDPRLRIRLGQAARERLLTEYNADRVSARQEESYARAIAHRRTVGIRPQTCAGLLH